MRIRNRIALAFAILITIAIAIKVLEALLAYLPRDFAEFYQSHKTVLNVILIIVGGAMAIHLLASASTSWLRGSREAYFIRNVILVIGYIILVLIVIYSLGISSEGVLASATFSGLIIGLALQPVLSNFFSGLLILLSGYLRPGQSVRIAGGIPVSILAFPAYKFFSRDYVIPSLKGQIVEIGFMYTKILDVDGQIVKVPNTLLLNSSIVIEKSDESKIIQVRYEFPIHCNPDEVLYRLHEKIQTIIKSYRLYIEEQIDKQYYIVLLVAEAPPKIKTREMRSAILKEFIKIHKELIDKGICVQSV